MHLLIIAAYTPVVIGSAFEIERVQALGIRTLDSQTLVLVGEHEISTATGNRSVETPTRKKSDFMSYGGFEYGQGSFGGDGSGEC